MTVTVVTVNGRVDSVWAHMPEAFDRSHRLFLGGADDVVVGKEVVK